MRLKRAFQIFAALDRRLRPLMQGT